jgi:hypothetical protein
VTAVQDDEVIARIDELVAEEHRLHALATGDDGLTQEDRDKLEAIEVRLDQCWDLLRQRRARRHAGQDPDRAEARPAEVVEHYQQ